MFAGVFRFLTLLQFPEASSSFFFSQSKWDKTGKSDLHRSWQPPSSPPDGTRKKLCTRRKVSLCLSALVGFPILITSRQSFLSLKKDQSPLSISREPFSEECPPAYHHPAVQIPDGPAAPRRRVALGGGHGDAGGAAGGQQRGRVPLLLLLLLPLPHRGGRRHFEGARNNCTEIIFISYFSVELLNAIPVLLASGFLAEPLAT